MHPMRGLLLLGLVPSAMACAGADATAMATVDWGIMPPGVTGHCFDMPTTTSGGTQLNRCYYRFVPPPERISSFRSLRLPLIVSLHGGGSCAEYRMLYDDAMQQDAIVIWPQATEMTMPAAPYVGELSSWNAGGGCCGQQAVDNIDDVAFIKQAISNVVNTFSRRVDPGVGVEVDLRLIRMTGHSMGCALAQRFLASGYGDIISAMSCTSHILFDSFAGNTGDIGSGDYGSGGYGSVDMFGGAPPPPTTPTLLIQGLLDTDIPYAGRDAANFQYAATYAGATPTPTNSAPAPPSLFWGDGFVYTLQSSMGNIAYTAAAYGCASIQTPYRGAPYQPGWLNRVLTSLVSAGAYSSISSVPVSIPYRASACRDFPGSTVPELYLLTLNECGHEAYLGMPVSTAGDAAAGVQPCTIPTTRLQFEFLNSHAIPDPHEPNYTHFEAPLIETSYEAGGGCDGGCVGGIIGGCFVPSLLFILWMSNVFAPKCPSPFAKKDEKKDAGGVTMTSIETAGQNAS